jgi:uncharacterized protein (DUF1015 family)
MAEVFPFRAITPPAAWAPTLIAPPYDTLDDAEARALASVPSSFVRVTRAEVDLPEGTDPHHPDAYVAARRNLEAFLEAGWLREDPTPAYWLYGLTWQGRRQLGLLGGCSVAAYDAGDVRKHEHTRPDKEQDRAIHMEALDAQVGLVFLAYRADAALDALLERLAQAPPAWTVATEDGVTHALWRVPDAQTEVVLAAVRALPRLYVADGHHRSAAASRVHARRQDAPSSTFLAGIFPDNQLRILPYQRVVHDLNGHTPAGLVVAIEAAGFRVEEGATHPPAPGTFAMYVDGRWATVHDLHERPDDPVARLDVSILQDRILAPLLGINDPRRSMRISFVGGIRGIDALAEGAARHGGVAFSLPPTSMEALFAVADAGDVMPPKSTWFEPKLREGVVSRWLR